MSRLSDGTTRRSRCAWRKRLPLVLSAALGLMLLFLVAVPTALATPGTPAAPTTVYQENFENGTGNTGTLLTNYTGAAGEKYTAAPAWLEHCNGEIVNFNTPFAELGNCGATNSTGHTRQLAYALGVQNGTADPATNHAVTAYTDNNPGPDEVEFETVNPISLTANGRYLTFGVNTAAVNCSVSAPEYQFYLLNGASTSPVGGLLNACTSGKTVEAPASGPVAAEPISVGTYTSNGSVLFTGSTLGIRMTNANGSGIGNDAAFDDIKILDVSPTLDKSFSPTTQYVGRTSTLTFTITNTSELASKEGWSFTDNLPSGLTVASPAKASTTCPGGQVTAASGGTSVAMKGNLNAREASCAVTVDVTATKQGSFNNGPSNVTSTGLNPPGEAAVKFIAPDVAIEKSATPSPLVPGKAGEYHLKVTDKGPGTAEGVVASDPLPKGVSFVSASEGCAFAGGTVTCNAGTMAEGTSKTFDIKVNLASSLSGSPSNTASVTSTTPDENQSNNTSQLTPTTEPQADLAVKKTAAPQTVTPGGQVIYTLVVENKGPSDDPEVKVVDPGATGLELVAANPSQGSCSIAGGHLACSLGTLVSGGSAQILVTAKATAASGDVPNTATVSGADKDTEPGNNQSTASVKVEPKPTPPTPQFDLVVTKKAAAKTIVVGATEKYTITVDNNGPDTAPNVIMKDTFNHNGTVVSATPSAGSCEKAMPLTCSLGDLKAGATVTITVVIRPLESDSPERNAASATGEGTDTNPKNNMDTADITVTPKLRVAKTVDRRSVKAGGILHYTIRVTNLSKYLARNVRTCDRMPSGLAYIGSKPKATLTKGTPCWSAAKLGGHKSVVYHVTAKVLRSAKGAERNVATAKGPGGKPVRGAAAVTVARPEKPKPTPVTG